MTAEVATPLDIERVVAGGDGLARNEGLVVFVPRTLAGEQVSARIRMRGRLARGELVSVDRPSPARVAPECVHYVGDSCGGCQLQHASYPEQLRIKSQLVSEAIRRIGRRDVDPPPVGAAPNPWRYRRKLTLAMRRDASGWYAGLRAHDRPDDVFHMRECLITRDDVWAVWQAILAAAEHLPAATELRGAVRVDANGVSTFVLEGGEHWPGAKQFFGAVPALASLWWTPAGGRRQQMAARDEASAGGTPGASFAQVNAEVADALRVYVRDRIASYNPAHVIDAYAGAGDLAAELSARGARVTAIEVDRDAARTAAERLAAPSRAVAARVEQVLGAHLPADVVVLNPPRSGVDARVCEILGVATPALRAILYVSCDPATLARDVGRLPGWRINSLACFDMFPQTAHVESVCELVPAGS